MMDGKGIRHPAVFGNLKACSDPRLIHSLTVFGEIPNTDAVSLIESDVIAPLLSCHVVLTLFRVAERSEDFQILSHEDLLDCPPP